MMNNCVARFFDRAEKFSDSEAFFVKSDRQYSALTWKDYQNMVERFAKTLIQLEYKKGEAVAILSFNRPEWLGACIGAQAANGVSAGIYTSCAPSDVLHVINHSEAKVVVVENKARFDQQIVPIIEQLDHVSYFVLIEDAHKIANKRTISWEDFLQIGDGVSSQELEKRRLDIQPEDIATFIYTSGTTGPAKAVMLSHRAIDFTVAEAINLIRVGKDDVLLSYLPLAHVAEQMFSVYAPIYSGMVLYFAESLEKLPENLKEARPTIFFGVPRVYEKFHEKLSEKIAGLQGLKRIMFNFFGGVTHRYWDYKHASSTVPPLLELQYWLGKKLLFSKVKEAIGMSRIRHCISGAAPISKSTLEFFAHIDLPVYEVYGQSEDSGPTSFNIPGQTKLGTVGRGFPGVEVKIADDGEICVRGPNLFSGYYKDAAATAEAMKDGWLLSGDIGELDSEGYLKITDRKKDLLITAGGKNIAPQNLENHLKQISLVSSAVVVGDRKKYLAAILTPNMDNLKNFAKKENIECKEEKSLVRNQKIQNEIQKEIDRLNAKLTPVEQIKKFHLLEQDFSIESGELTPTMKVKRKVVNSRYENVINDLYAS